MTIIRLHTISLYPLCPGRLLWAAFLLAQKHIVQPSSENMQKHLDQKGSGPLPVRKIFGLASFINIRDQCFSAATSHIWTEKKGTHLEKNKETANKWTGAGTDCISFYCSVNNYVQIFLLSCRYHSTWGTNTALDSHRDVFQIRSPADWHILTAWGSLVIGGARYRSRIFHFNKSDEADKLYVSHVIRSRRVTHASSLQRLFGRV